MQGQPRPERSKPSQGEPLTKEADTRAGLPLARLIVCERTGCWAVALRRELGGAEVDLLETRSLADCWDALGESPASLAVVELHGPTVDDLLCRMSTMQHDLPLARVAVVASRCLGPYEGLVREAGAVHFTCSLRQLAPLAEIARRHLAQAPISPRTLTQRIWESLPWGAARNRRTGASQRDESEPQGDE